MKSRLKREMTQKGMSPLRYHHLMNNLEEKLTEEEIKAGWRFCCEWDGLLIHKTDPEGKCCSCP